MVSGWQWVTSFVPFSSFCRSWVSLLLYLRGNVTWSSLPPPYYRRLLLQSPPRAVKELKYPCNNVRKKVTKWPLVDTILKCNVIKYRFFLTLLVLSPHPVSSHHPPAFLAFCRPCFDGVQEPHGREGDGLRPILRALPVRGREFRNRVRSHQGEGRVVGGARLDVGSR